MQININLMRIFFLNNPTCFNPPPQKKTYDDGNYIFMHLQEKLGIIMVTLLYPNIQI